MLNFRTNINFYAIKLKYIIITGQDSGFKRKKTSVCICKQTRFVRCYVTLTVNSHNHERFDSPRQLTGEERSCSVVPVTQEVHQHLHSTVHVHVVLTAML